MKQAQTWGLIQSTGVWIRKGAQSSSLCLFLWKAPFLNVLILTLAKNTIWLAGSDQEGKMAEDASSGGMARGWTNTPSDGRKA